MVRAAQDHPGASNTPFHPPPMGPSNQTPHPNPLRARGSSGLRMPVLSLGLATALLTLVPWLVPRPGSPTVLQLGNSTPSHAMRPIPSLVRLLLLVAPVDVKPLNSTSGKLACLSSKHGFLSRPSAAPCPPLFYSLQCLGRR